MQIATLTVQKVLARSVAACASLLLLPPGLLASECAQWKQELLIRLPPDNYVRKKLQAENDLHLTYLSASSPLKKRMKTEGVQQALVRYKFYWDGKSIVIHPASITMYAGLGYQREIAVDHHSALQVAIRKESLYSDKQWLMRILKEQQQGPMHGSYSKNYYASPCLESDYPGMPGPDEAAR